MDDTQRLNWLEEMFTACPHAVITFIDDADEAEDTPLGYTISIDGCEPLEANGATLREAIDAAIADNDRISKAGYSHE